MAALQTLRNKPALLLSIIGGALLLFIVTLTDFNSCSRPNIEGTFDGKELTYETMEAQIANEETLESLLFGSITEQQKNLIRQGVWDRFVQQQTLAEEAERLGLTISDDDVQQAIRTVTPQQLQQVMQMIQYGQMNLYDVSSAQKIMLLMANYLGQPSADAYQQFMKDVDRQIAQLGTQNPEAAELYNNIKNACLYCESQIKQELLLNKYMTLFQAGITSNAVAAQSDYNVRNTTYDLTLVTIPYSTIADKDITYTDDDLKKKYEEVKERFRVYAPSRDLQAINVQVTASAQDQNNIQDQVQALEDTLRGAKTADAVMGIMKGGKSVVDYRNVYLPRDVYAENSMADVASALDTLSVGQVTPTRVEPRDRDGVQYISTMKLVSVKTTPDSMQICQFAVDSKDLADSLVAAVRGGKSLSEAAASHNDLAQRYGLKGDTTWYASRYYVDVEASADSVKPAYTDVCQIPVGTVDCYTVQNPQTGQPIYVVTHVLAAKANSTKYNVAVVKYPITFSSETYNAKKRALQEFLAKNKTVEAIMQNAQKSGYTMLDLSNYTTSQAMQARLNIGGEGAKEAFIWAFDKAKAGEVSAVYECGHNNDQLLVLCMTGSNDGEYLAWDAPSVKSQLETLVKQDKKAEKIMAMLTNVKTLQQAQAVKGAESSPQPNATISYFASYEPAVAGALQRAQKGQLTGGIKGVSGVYMLQLNEVKAGSQTFNAGMAMIEQNYAKMRQLLGQNGHILQALTQKHKIVDNRYKF